MADARTVIYLREYYYIKPKGEKLAARDEIYCSDQNDGRDYGQKAYYFSA